MNQIVCNTKRKVPKILEMFKMKKSWRKQRRCDFPERDPPNGKNIFEKDPLTATSCMIYGEKDLYFLCTKFPPNLSPFKMAVERTSMTEFLVVCTQGRTKSYNHKVPVRSLLCHKREKTGKC